jgi:soluble lytic murein transglycosylase-like protein
MTKEVKLVKVIKKYSHLFLFGVLFNFINVSANAQNAPYYATANAQTIQYSQYSNQRAAAPEAMNRTGGWPLQGLRRAATTLALMTADIVAPMAPIYLPEPSETIAPPPPPPVKIARPNANASATVIAWSSSEASGVGNSVSKLLKGQSTGDERIDTILVEAGTRHGVEPLLLYSVMHQESAFNSSAISHKGARGLMQLMPATAARFGVKNIFDPEQNIDGAAQYLRLLLDMFDGDVKLALAGYNAGEGAVKKYGYSVPPYPETINYVRKITRRYTVLTTISE